ncbi:hypothetical protein FE697_010370 [Mumia zhuanghuii]|uniref:Uncharacterized protein n=2 Tax=Mumia TaxID=1546255 RepID=A0A5Q6RWY8_9ACTN|nr:MULTISPECIES: hypothetical protein [Mumia]KAA1422592.1 hypothetical protein FE697_010370 [Mumia zhuanghuii]
MKKFRALTVTAAAAALTLLTAVPANAVTLNYEYDANGWTHIHSTDSDLWIKPTKMQLAIQGADGTFTGHMPISPADTKFEVLGFLPIKAQVSFEEAAPLNGGVVRVGNIARVDSTASYYVRLSNVLIGGIPSPVGSSCRTKDPVTLSVSTPAGEAFNIASGGNLAGSFTIGDFEHCLLNTLIINQLVPGDGNMTLAVTNAKFISATNP